MAFQEQLQQKLQSVDTSQVTRKFGGRWKLLFFTNAVSVTVAGVLSIIIGISSMAPPFDFINYCYLTLFGLLMLLIDLPIDNITIREFRICIFTYGLFMTRFVGRGVWYIFLSAMVFGSLWDNEISPFLGFILGGYILGVACYSLLFGYNMTRKLEYLRGKIRAQGPDNWSAYVPPVGMTKVQLRDLGASLANVVFTDEELTFIVDGFSFSVRSDDLVSREEFEEWVTSGTMMIL